MRSPSTMLGLLLLMTALMCWTTRALAQTPPTKTPIGDSPTKTSVPDQPPTKTPEPVGVGADLTLTPITPPTKTPITEPPTKTPLPSAPTAIKNPAPAASANTPSLSAPATPAPSPTVSGMPMVLITPTVSLSVTGPVMIASPERPAVTFDGSDKGPDPSLSTAQPLPLVVTQAVNLSGYVLGLAILGGFIWLGFAQVGRLIVNEIRSVSVANLRIQHEAERIARRDKVTFRADADVLGLLEQAILDAVGEGTHVRFVTNGLLSSPPMLAVTDQDHVRYIFSPIPPDQTRRLRRRNGLVQFIFGSSTQVTSHPLDALNSSPFVSDDLGVAFSYLITRWQMQRRPLPRADRWYIYVARPPSSRWTLLLNRRRGQPTRPTGSLRQATDRLQRSTPPIPSETSSETAPRSGE